METIQIFTKEALQQIKDCVKHETIDTAVYGESAAWLDTFLADKGIDYVRDKTDVFLSLPALKEDDKQGNYDLENAISLYEAMPLNRYQATDMRLWASLAHYEYGQYMKNRWPLKQNPIRNILVRYLGTDKPFSRHGLARLWWSVQLTIDEAAKNDTEKYRYTRLFWKDQDRADNLSAYRLCHIKPLLWAVLEAYETYPNTFSNRELRRLFIKKLNQFGGIKCLDALDKKQLSHIVDEQAKQF